MGTGGFLTLLNATNYDWTLKSNGAYQMVNWQPPSTLLAGQCNRMYVEFSEAIFKTASDDSAWAQYHLEGTDYTFSINAKADNGYYFVAKPENFDTDCAPAGTQINLGFKHDGTVNWVLGGKSAPFICRPANNWMQSNLAAFGDLTLRQLCLPGSHDSGMSTRTGGTAFGTPANTCTQTRSIADQLNLGCRFFDLRPVNTGGRLAAGHYSYIDQIKSWQGANGEFLDDIIAGINAFTSSNRELIIITVSHVRDTDAGNSNYPPFDQNGWNRLLGELSHINHLYTADPSVTDLTTLPLKTFISNGPAVIIICQPEGDVNLGSYAGKGFYTDSQVHYNSAPDWSPAIETEDPNQKASQCLDALKQKRTDPKQPPCGLGWTLTQSAGSAVSSSMGMGPSIIDLAGRLQLTMAIDIWNGCSKQTFPNVINVDAFDQDVTGIAVAITSHLALN